MQIGRAADAAQQVAAVQLGGDGDGVSGLAATVQVEDGVVDVLVRRPVEVTGPEALEHVGDRVLAQQHATEYGLFCSGVLRGLAAEVLSRGRDVHPRMTEVIHDSHDVSPPPRRARTCIRYSLP